MNLCKLLCVSLCFIVFFVGLADTSYGQERSRIVQSTSQPTNQPTTETRRPTLTTQLIIRQQQQQQQQQQNQPLVKKTSSSALTNSAANTVNSTIANVASMLAVRRQMMSSIKSKYGLPYIYGSTGPGTYDCSGFIWSVFNESGIDFERSSARTYWSQFEPVFGGERYQFGTLVFFNNLGHIGIVADSEGFYHASTSKGITYSKFDGYWENRIVGFRRIPVEYLTAR
jgi:cell wall-associated NlpC family hydrolase